MKTSIVSIKRVKNDRLQAELVDAVNRGRVNTLALLNVGDKAFDPKSFRHAWFPVTIESLIQLGATAALIEKIEKLKINEKVESSIVDPTIEGKKLRIQVTENFMKASKQLTLTKEVVANESLAKHPRSAEFIGDQGYFLTETGEHIFSNSTVEIEEQVNHTFLDGYLVPEELLAGASAVLAKPIKVANTSDVTI